MLLALAVLFSFIGGYAIGNMSVGDLKRQVATLEGQVVQLHSQVANLNEQVEMLESERTKLESEKLNLSRKIQSLEDDLAKLKDSMDSPILFILQPKNGSTVSRKTQIYGSYYDRNNDLTEIRVQIDNRVMDQVTFSEGFWNYTLNPSDMPEGWYLIVVSARDAKGREFNMTLELNIQHSPIAKVIPEIDDYPDLEFAFIEIYYSDKHIDSQEADYITTIFNVLKEYGRLQSYPRDILPYAVSWESYSNHYDPAFFKDVIIPLGRSLRGRNDLDTALNIYSWVNSYMIEYADISMWDWDIKTIYTLRRGQCGERSQLMTAILRASGIPARCVMGFSDPCARNPDPRKGHAWVEIFYNDSWIPVDSTGYLSTAGNGLVDFKERIYDDVYYITLIPKRIIWYENSAGARYTSESAHIVYVGEKYSIYYAAQLLRLARNNEAKNKAMQYISLFKSARSWSDRQKYGRLAIENAVISIGNFSKIYFSWELAGVEELDENSVVICHSPEMFVSSPIPRSLECLWDFQYHDSTEMEGHPLFGYPIFWLCWKGRNRNITVIVIDTYINDLLILSSSDVKNLIDKLLNIKEESKQVLRSLISTLLKVESGTIDGATFTIPSIGTKAWFTAVGPAHTSGYAFLPAITVSLSLGRGWTVYIYTDVNQWFSNESRWVDFRYVKLIDNKGNQLIELTNDGYLKKCPAYMWATLPQTVYIRKEGQFLIIACDMYLGWDLIFG